MTHIFCYFADKLVENIYKEFYNDEYKPYDIKETNNILTRIDSKTLFAMLYLTVYENNSLKNKFGSWDLRIRDMVTPSLLVDNIYMFMMYAPYKYDRKHHMFYIAPPLETESKISQQHREYIDSKLIELFKNDEIVSVLKSRTKFNKPNYITNRALELYKSNA